MNVPPSTLYYSCLCLTHTLPVHLNPYLDPILSIQSRKDAPFKCESTDSSQKKTSRPSKKRKRKKTAAIAVKERIVTTITGEGVGGER